MENKKKFFMMILILTMIISMFAAPSLASEAQKRLDNIAIKVGDKNVIVSMKDYSSAYMDAKDGINNQLYNYLKGENETPKITAVGSEDKYMSIKEYSTSFMDSNKDASKAIETALALSEEVVDNFFIFEGFDENGKEVIEPITKTYTVKDLGGTVGSPVAGYYAVRIKFDNAKAAFPEITTSLVLVLKMDGADDVELTYDEIKNMFINDDIQGSTKYSIESLENAKVEIKSIQNEETEEFKVISIY